MVRSARYSASGEAARRLAKIAARLGQCVHRILRQCEGQAQRAQQFAQAVTGVLVSPRLGRVGKHHQVQLAGEVVDHGDFLGQEQQHVGAAEGVGLEPAARQAPFYPAHRVVAKIANEAAAKARQAGQRRGLGALEVGAYKLKRIAACALDDIVAAQHADLAATRDTAHRRREADKGIAAKALAAHHRFE